MKLRSRRRLASRLNHLGPADEGRHPYPALPLIQLGSIVTTKRVQVVCFVHAHVIQAAFVQRPIVGGKHHQGLVIDFQIHEELDQIRQGIVEASNHGGVASGMVRPGLPVISNRVGNLGVHPAIYRSTGRVDLPLAGIFIPLHAATQSAAFGIIPLVAQVRVRGDTQSRMGRGVAEVGKEWLLRMRVAMIHNPLLGTRGKQIGRIALFQSIGHIDKAVIERTVSQLGIVVVSISMGRVTIERIEASQQRMGRLRLRRTVTAHRLNTQLIRPSRHTPFADGNRGVSGLLHHGTQSVHVRQLRIELEIASRTMPLMSPRHQGRARRHAR